MKTRGNYSEIHNAMEVANAESNIVEKTTQKNKSEKSNKMQKVSQEEVATIKVNCRGEEMEIIPVYDPRMRTVTQWKTNAIESKVNESLRFRRIYQFNRAESFFKEGRDLINQLTGTPVKEFDERMFLCIPTIETSKEFFVNQIYLSETIDISINNFTVEECFQALAGDEIMCSPASNKDWLNWTCEVTKDQYLINVRDFMEESDLKNITTAMKYFNAVPSMSKIKLGAISGKFQTMESRTPNVAKEIFETTFSKFGRQAADSKFIIDCVNKKCGEGYKLEEILIAIKALDLSAVRVMTVRGIGCLDKEECISNEITVKLQELGFRAELKRKAA